MPKTKKFKLPFKIAVFRKIPLKLTLSMALVIIFIIAIGVYNSLPIDDAQAAAPTFTVKIQAKTGGSNWLAIEFDQNVYTNSDGTGDLTVSDFSVTGTDTVSLSSFYFRDNTAVVYVSPINVGGPGEILITCATNEVYNAAGEACTQAPVDLDIGAIIDATPPTIANWTLDMSTAYMTVTFDESMIWYYFNAVNENGIILQDAVTATTSYTLTSYDSQGDWLSLDTLGIQLSTTDFAAILADTGLATNAGNSYLRFTTTTNAQDLVRNYINIADGSAVPVNTYTADTSSPVISIVSPATGSTTREATPVAVLANEFVDCTYDLDSGTYTGTLAYDGDKYVTDNIYNMTSGVGISPGSHTLQITCTDWNSNPPTVASTTWTKLDPGNSVLLGSDGIGGNLGSLYVIDPRDGTITSTIGATGTCLTGLAVHPITGQLYGVSTTSCSAGPNSLYTVDLTTGAATLLALMSGDITISNTCGPGLPDYDWGSVGDITFDPTGYLYGGDCDGYFYQIETDLLGTAGTTSHYLFYNHPTLGLVPGTEHGYAWGSGVVYDSSISGMWWLPEGDSNDGWSSSDAASLAQVILGTPNGTYINHGDTVNGTNTVALNSAALDSAGILYSVRSDKHSSSPQDLVAIEKTSGIVVTMGLLTNSDMVNMTAITFYEDTYLPIVTITPTTKTGGAPYTDTTVNVVDYGGITAANVTASLGSTLACTQTSNTVVDCTSTINKESITVTAIDDAGNTGVALEAGYEILGRSGGGGGAGDINPPSAPTNIKLIADNTGKVTITWTDPLDSDLGTIVIQRDHNPIVGTIVDAVYDQVNKAEEIYIESGLIPGETYLYRVRAKDLSGNLSENLTEYAIVIPTQPGETEGVDVTEPEATTPILPPAETPDLILTEPEPADSLPLGVAIGDLVKVSDNSAVYFIDSDKRRHTFPDATVYFSWFSDFSKVKTISKDIMSQIEIGSNVTMRSGTWLIKITTDPRVYAVEPYGVLRWIQTEEIATALYGPSWATKIKDVRDALFADYQTGSPISDMIYPTGSLIQYTGETTVYYIEGTVKQAVSTEVFVNNLFQDKFVNREASQDTKYITDFDLEAMPIWSLVKLK